MSFPKWLLLTSVSPEAVPVACWLFRRPSKISKCIWPRLLSNYWLHCTWSVWDFACILWEWSLCFLQPSGSPYANSTVFQSQVFWGLIFLVQDPGDAEPNVRLRPLSFCGETLQLWLSSFLCIAYLGMWVLTILCLSPSYPSLCGFVFISLGVKNLFC